MHEQTHIEIFRSYGVESHTEYFSNFPDFVTISDKPCPSVQCVQDHNNVEAIGYQLLPLFLMIAFGLFFIIILLELKMQQDTNFK